MSRIGIKPVVVADSLTVDVSPVEVRVKGPQGELTVALPVGIQVTVKDGQLIVTRTNQTQFQRAMHGTVRSLLQNAVTGAGVGFERKLELVGIGYRAAMEGQDLVLQLGYTHPVRLTLPTGITAKVEKNVIILAGKDKQALGQFAADVRSTRKPDAYKGKGVRYQGELVRLKQGKAAKAGA